jgi:hypothetical protein
MIVGIIGSRRRNTEQDKTLIEKELLKLLDKNKDITICSGGCPTGGDLFAEQLASKYYLKKKIYIAEWHHYGQAAGFIRNTYIAEDSDILIACVAEDRRGGTEDTIKKFKKFHPNWESEESLILV